MKRKLVLGALIVLVVAIVSVAITFSSKYWTSSEMVVAVEETTTIDYPEDPANRSAFYNRYPDRSLRLIDQGDGLFTFSFESENPHVATVTFKDIDVARFVPTAPEWTRDGGDLEKVTLIEREWNRQQVTFDRASPHLEVSGGDGFEETRLVSAELARNCLNAGLWEVQLFTEEEGKKALYYQGWFTFPLGHYKRLFEKNNDLSYWKYWMQLEHWLDPEGAQVPLDKLRTVVGETSVEVLYDPGEQVLVGGEQQRKLRSYDAKNVRSWGDFFKNGKSLRFATFLPPGRYSVKKPWGNEFERLTELKGATLRRTRSPASRNVLEEIELVFENPETGEKNRFIVGGFDLEQLPRANPRAYYDGYVMPMGISVPPVSQSYDELVREAPYETGYFSVLLDEEGRWINHHRAAVDGVVLHRDEHNGNLLHVYLLSYERHALIGHYVLVLDS